MQTTNKSNIKEGGHKEQNDDKILRTFQMENLWPNQRSPRDDKFSHNEVSFGSVRDARVIPRFYHHPLWSCHLFFIPPTARLMDLTAGRKLDGSSNVRFFGCEIQAVKNVQDVRGIYKARRNEDWRKEEDGRRIRQWSKLIKTLPAFLRAHRRDRERYFLQTRFFLANERSKVFPPNVDIFQRRLHSLFKSNVFKFLRERRNISRILIK